MTLLRVWDLRVRLHDGATPVLHGVDLTVARGESVGVVGESGSGKTMLALAVMGLLPPAACASGAIRFDGTDLLAASERALCRYRGDRVGMVFQEPMTALDPLRRIDDQVGEPLRLHRGLSRTAARAEARTLLARVGLSSPEAYPHRLSGGQRQRVAIAAALACGPDLLIADEPTTALDALVQARTLDLIDALVAERGMAMLLVSHDLGVIAGRTRRVAVMYAGRVVDEGDTRTVLARRRHPYTRALLAASPHATDGRMPEPLAGRMPAVGDAMSGCPFAPRCPRAAADCVAAMPPLAGDSAHRTACWHPVD